MSEQNSPVAVFGGLALAGSGVAHLVRPDLFENITKQLFPDDTQKHTYIDGALEAVIGVGLVVRQTRKLAVAGLIGYGVYLAGSAIRNR